MPGIYRTDLARVAWGPEATFGAGAAAYSKVFGYVQGTVTLPDPRMGFIPYFGIGVSGRDRKTIIKGPQEFTGSIPDIMILHDASRELWDYIIGQGSENASGAVPASSAAAATISYTATSMTDTAGAFGAYKDGTYAVFSGISVGYIGAGGAANTVNVYTFLSLGTAGWNGPISVGGASGDGYEIRRVRDGQPKLNFVEQEVMRSFAISRLYRASLGEANLAVNYLGCKVNRATLAAAEGAQARLSLDEIVAQDLIHNVDIPASLPKYSAGTLLPSFTFPNEEPYVYSEGRMSFFEHGNVFARVRRFSLRVTHNIEQARYLSIIGAQYAQIPYEHIEGRREYALEVEVDVMDRQFWEHLVREGLNDALTTKTGFDIQLRFTKSNGDILEVHGPAPSNPVIINGVGEALNGATNYAATGNIGCALLNADHPYATDEGGLLRVRAAIDVPSLIVRLVDA